MAFKQFVSPHVHVQSLDSASTPEEFAKREKELGSGYLVCTDHGTLEATRLIYDLCQSKDYKGVLKPICGLEGYFRDDDCPILLGAGYKKDEKGSLVDSYKYGHVTMHAGDELGYTAIVKAISKADNRAEQHGQERKPLFGWADLEELGGHNITMTAGCLIGMVGRNLMQNNDIQSAIKYYERLRSIPKQGNFYVEVFPHKCDRDWKEEIICTYEDGTKDNFALWKNVATRNGKIKAESLAKDFAKHPGEARKLHGSILEVMIDRKMQPRNSPSLVSVEHFKGYIHNECQPWCPNGDMQEGVNNLMIALATKYGDPILLSDDSHFTHPELKLVQDIRLAQGGGTWKFSNANYRMSSEDAWGHFNSRVPESQFEGWIENTINWAHKFDNFKLTKAPSLPVSFYPKDTLTHVMGIIEKNKRMDWNDPVRVERLKKELKMIHKNKMTDLLPYFFTVEEVVDLHVRGGKLPGPGRGSAAGLSLSYYMGVTHPDPLEFKLSEDRFLTEDRIEQGKMPDIDTDLPDRDLLVEGEGEVLEVTFHDGTVKTFEAGTMIDTEDGRMTIEEAFETEAEIYEDQVHQTKD